jgi:hypothetical protein
MKLLSSSVLAFSIACIAFISTIVADPNPGVNLFPDVRHNYHKLKQGNHFTSPVSNPKSIGRGKIVGLPTKNGDALEIGSEISFRFRFKKGNLVNKFGKLSKLYFVVTRHNWFGYLTRLHLTGVKLTKVAKDVFDVTGRLPARMSARRHRVQVWRKSRLHGGIRYRTVAKSDKINFVKHRVNNVMASCKHVHSEKDNKYNIVPVLILLAMLSAQFFQSQRYNVVMIVVDFETKC